MPDKIQGNVISEHIINLRRIALNIGKLLM